MSKLAALVGWPAAEARAERNGTDSAPEVEPPVEEAVVEEPETDPGPERDPRFERALANDIRGARADVRSHAEAWEAARHDLGVEDDALLRLQDADERRVKAAARLNTLLSVRERYFVTHDLFEYETRAGSALPRRVEPDPEVWG